MINIVIITIIVIILSIGLVAVYGEKQECMDRRNYEFRLPADEWKSEGHDDNKASEEEFEESVEDKRLCKTAKDIDHEKADGEIDDWTDFKETETYRTATHEQRECLKNMFDSPDQDNGNKALQGYEIQDCAIDPSKKHGEDGY